MHPLLDPNGIPALVATARRVVPPSWTLDHVVAVNPLHGLEDLPFEDALVRAADLYGAQGYLPTSQRRAILDAGGTTSLAAEGVPAFPVPARAVGQCATELRRWGSATVAPLVDALVGHWCVTHLASGHGRHAHGGAAQEVYAAWRTVAPFDPDLAVWSDGAHAAALEAIPTDPAAAIAQLLHRLGVDDRHAVPYLEAQCARLPGWVAAFAREDAVLELLALRLTVERLLLDSPKRPELAVPAAAAPTFEIEDVLARAEWQERAEHTYRDGLLGALAPRLGAPVGPRPAVRPKAQVVFCIDVRSESVRRHLETVGRYETFGFAGFFGLPVAVRTVDHDEPVASCPVILDPRATVAEAAVAGRLAPLAERDAAHHSFHGAKAAGAPAFALADASGWLLGLRSIAGAVAPDAYARTSDRFRNRRRKAARTRFVLDPEHAPAGTGLSVHEQATMAHGALTAMGLTRDFAPVVVVCGHGSANRNNPYRSALDCGACGGNPGGPNARILAAICNRADVRAALATRGIEIPDDTWFVAAEHETTDDTITLLDVDDVPAPHRAAVLQVERDLNVAGALANAERHERLPAPPTATRRGRRSADPAQVVPDWGLARCAAIVVGPRTLTQGVDLDRRVFLHSYRPDADTEGQVLEAIMGGPIVVAHWICSQYYFSTVDPHCFGAGSKPLHNVIDRIGVSEGASLDLRIGLPLESVWFDGRPVHDPLRLLVVIDAPVARVEEIIARQPMLQRIFGNGWARLVARGEGPTFVERSRQGDWRPWVPEDADPVRVSSGVGGVAGATDEHATRVS